jgi:hypothetical protein
VRRRQRCDFADGGVATLGVGFGGAAAGVDVRTPLLYDTRTHSALSGAVPPPLSGSSSRPSLSVSRASVSDAAAAVAAAAAAAATIGRLVSAGANAGFVTRFSIDRCDTS